MSSPLKNQPSQIIINLIYRSPSKKVKIIRLGKGNKKEPLLPNLPAAVSDRRKLTTKKLRLQDNFTMSSVSDEAENVKQFVAHSGLLPDRKCLNNKFQTDESNEGSFG